MHTLTLTTLALLSALATAQIPGLPNCAASCVNDSFGSCGSLDVGCICSNKELLTGLSCCVSKACSKEDQDKTLQFANSICAGQGANNLPTAATCAGGDAASTTSGAAPSATGSSSSASDAAMTTSGSMASSTSGEQTGSSTASDSYMETGSVTGSMTSSAESASETAASATDGASSTTERPAASTGGADGIGLRLGSAGLGVVLAGIAAVL